MSTSTTTSQNIADDLLVDLALQGGGAHGAFSWGVLDRLLEEKRLGIDGISGTSAGAMNAAALADASRDAAANSPGPANGQNGAVKRSLLRLGRSKPEPEPEPEPEGPVGKVVRQQPVRQARSKRSGKR